MYVHRTHTHTDTRLLHEWPMTGQSQSQSQTDTYREIDIFGGTSAQIEGDIQELTQADTHSQRYRHGGRWFNASSDDGGALVTDMFPLAFPASLYFDIRLTDMKSAGSHTMPNLRNLT